MGRERKDRNGGMIQKKNRNEKDRKGVSRKRLKKEKRGER
jgi:hypothetical protein